MLPLPGGVRSLLPLSTKLAWPVPLLELVRSVLLPLPGGVGFLLLEIVRSGLLELVHSGLLPLPGVRSLLPRSKELPLFLVARSSLRLG